MAAGLPAVVWKKAAIAKFIEKYDVGYTINNLYEINDIDFSDYKTKLKNVLEMKEKVRNGYFLNEAMKVCLEKINSMQSKK